MRFSGAEQMAEVSNDDVGYVIIRLIGEFESLISLKLIKSLQELKMLILNHLLSTSFLPSLEDYFFVSCFMDWVYV